MRTNKKSIQIASLNEKKLKNDLKKNPEGAMEVIKEHKKRTAKEKLKVVPVPGDHFRTVFYINPAKDPEKVLQRYKDSRKY
jgi:putative heme iron utilization protein